MSDKDRNSSLIKEPPFQMLDLSANQPAPPSLANIGNTCWMNSVLQALLSLTALNNAIIAETNSRKVFIALMRNAINSNGASLAEPQTLSAIGKQIQSRIQALRIGDQNCADEGLIAAFDLISDSEHAISPIGTKYTSRTWCNRASSAQQQGRLRLTSSNPKIINYISPILIPPQMKPTTEQQFSAIIRVNETTITAKCAACTRDALIMITPSSSENQEYLRNISITTRTSVNSAPQHQLQQTEIEETRRKWNAMSTDDQRMFLRCLRESLDSSIQEDNEFILESRGVVMPWVSHEGLILRESLSRVQEIIVLRFNRIQLAQGDRIAHWYPIKFRIPHIRPNNTNDFFEFELCAVINHSGGDGGGHYTAYVRRGPDWYHANDSSITRMQSHPQPESTAFLLFYHLARFVS